MKKALITLIFTGVTTLLFSQETEEYVYKLPNNIFKLNPAAFANRTLQADYEMFFDKDKMSLQLSPKGTIYKDAGSNAYGLGFELTYRKYLRDVLGRGKSHETLAYFYGAAGYSYYDSSYETFEPGGSWNSEPISTGIHNEYINKYSADVGFGVQFLFKRLISIDMNLGGGLRLADSNQSETYWNVWAGDYGHTGFVPKLSIAIGIVGEK